MCAAPTRSLIVALALGALSCSRPDVKATRLPDGTRELECRLPLWKCLMHVDDYCKGASYEVLGASDEQKLYGPAGEQVESRKSKAVIHCLGLHARPVGARTAGSAEAARVEAPKEAKPARACVPGSTQACVGAGACSGGQACLRDGSGFGPCDCGPAKSDAPSAAPASSVTAPPKP